MTDIDLLKLIGTDSMVTPHTADQLANCIRLFELGHLTICPPGDRYKLSQSGREIVAEVVR